MQYTPPLRDMQFALHEVLGATDVLSAAGTDIDAETIDGILSTVGEFSAEVLAPLNAGGDRQGCSLVDGQVRTPQGFKRAYDEYVAGGWPAVECDEDHGGGSLPHAVGVAIKEMLTAANPGWTLYTSLSNGAYRCINANASDELRERFLPQLASGRWTGTMCLTEPDAGTDLGLVSTSAVPADDGTYAVSGTKMFISSGDHDLAENIIHLVLARTPDAPAGTRGLSLFIVPKLRVDDDGAIGGSNGVETISLENKMGLHGNATAMLHFDGATGYLVGEVNRGLAAMFVMMNGARLGTGVQALGMIEAASQLSETYAAQRLQSRAPRSLRDESRAADPIINQPDVRRMLLTQQSSAGGARMFLYWLALQVHLSQWSPDELVRERAEETLSLLTPVAKAFVTDRAVEAASTAMQVHGGVGFIQETGAEQIYRDTRILPIYEGTNGVQAHDLLQRKVLADQGAKMQRYINSVRDFATTLAERSDMDMYRSELISLADELEAVTAELKESAAVDDIRVGASARDYLDLVGHFSFAYFWAQAADVVSKLGSEADSFHRRQATVARFYFGKILPATKSLLVSVRAETSLLMDDAAIHH